MRPPGLKLWKLAVLKEISLGMFPSQNFQEIQDEISVLLTVSLFIIVVIAPPQQ